MRVPSLARALPFAFATLALALCLSGQGAAAQEAQPLPPGNAEAGAKVFNRCKACHQIGPGAESNIGPELNGVMGRPAGKLPDYVFSEGLASAGFVWDDAHMAEWLRGTKKMIPTTKMIFPGIRKDQDMADLLAYLHQFKADGSTAP